MRKLHWVLILCFISQLYADFKSQTYENPPITSYEFLEFTKRFPFNRETIELYAQEDEWYLHMKNQGKLLIKNNVKLIYFIHGTFVGNDPIGIITTLKSIYPEMDASLEEALKDIAKNNNNILLEDMGNYTPKYIRLFERAIGNKIPCFSFNWSSENHHIARVKGTFQLIRKLAEDIRAQSLQKKDRILVMGHSHAGQLFAILTNILDNSSGTKEIIEIAKESGENTDNITEDLAVIREMSLDIVTFGTPPRYGWGDKGYRLLNVINHRGDNYKAGDVGGLLFTLDGDYVQQWGIAGTDLIPLTKKDQEFNKRLDSILGEGCDIITWVENVQAKMRIPQYGKTILVDYKDGNKVLPNAITTFLGHGVYTKYEVMLFNTTLIAEQLYPE